MAAKAASNTTTMTAATVNRFEEARKEHEGNERLRRAVFDADLLLSRAHALPSAAAGSSTAGGGSGSATPAAKRRSEVQKWVLRTNEQLQEYEKGCGFKQLRRVNPQRLITDCQLQLPAAELMRPGMRGSSEALSRVGDALHRLQKMKRNVAPLTTFSDNGSKTIGKCCTLLQDSALQSSVWASLPDALLVLLEEVIELPSAEALLEEPFEALRRMTFSVDEMTQQQEQAVSDGDMKLVETLYFKKITVQEAMVDIYNQMYRQLDANYKECFVTPLKRVHEVHRVANTNLSATMSQNDERKQKVEADLAQLSEVQKSIKEDAKNAEKRFAELKDASDRFLKDNATHMDQCYAAMEEIERQLNKLSQERSEALQKRVHAIEEEEKRRADANNVENFVKEHRVLLETTMHNLDVAEEVTDLVDELISSGCNAVEQRMRDIDASINAQRAKIHEHRLQHFRQLYLTIGDLQYKKERHMEELDKKIEQVHIQQELAMETFNPKAKEFSQVKKDLLKVRDDMQSQVQVLSDKAVLQIEAFKPTETALIESGKQFVNPVEELAARNRNRQLKLLEYHQLMSQGGGSGGTASTTGGGGAGGDNNNGTTTSSPIAAEISRELQQIEEERAKAVPRRPLHSSQGRNASSSSGLGSTADSPMKKSSSSSAL